MAFTNRNTCKNFTLPNGLSQVRLSAYECTQITFVVPANSHLTLFSESDTTNGLQIDGPNAAGSTIFTYTGITNASELSATTSGGGCSYRTQYFDNYNLAVQM
jgi:hypothetical protein